MAAKATHVSHLVENILTYYTQKKTTQCNMKRAMKEHRRWNWFGIVREALEVSRIS